MKELNVRIENNQNVYRRVIVSLLSLKKLNKDKFEKTHGISVKLGGIGMGLLCNMLEYHDKWKN